MESHLLCCLPPHSLPFLFFSANCFFQIVVLPRTNFSRTPDQFIRRYWNQADFPVPWSSLICPQLGTWPTADHSLFRRRFHTKCEAEFLSSFVRSETWAVLATIFQVMSVTDGLQRQKRGWYSERGRGEEKGKDPAASEALVLVSETQHNICPLHSMAKILLIPF